MSKRISFKAGGTVQGVNFRAWTAKKANSINVTGFIQNDSDGNHVSGEAQGDQSSLDKFVQHLHNGPSAAKVSNVEHKDIDVKEGESSFSENR